MKATKLTGPAGGAIIAPMGTMDKAFEAMKKMTPKKGYNVVGVDDYELPGEELFLVGNYATEEEANAACEAEKKDNPGTEYYVYGPDKE